MTVLTNRWKFHFVVFFAALLSVVVENPAVVSAQSGSEVFYKEKFGFCTDSLGVPATSQAHWIALKSGQPVGKPGYLKVFGYGNDSEGGSVNSDPIGLAQGYAFWSKAVYGLTIFTSEFPFDVSLLDSVDYEQKLSGVDAALIPNGTRLAILVNYTWYFSDRVVRQQGKPGANWKPATFRPFEETYGTSSYSSTVGAAIPSNSGIPLPVTGTVQAFGVFLDEVNGRVRIDNFRINGIIPDGSLISTGEQTPDVTRCPAGSPDTGGNGGVPPTATPTKTPGGSDGDDDDSGGGIDQQIPDETPPPQLKTPTPTPTSTPKATDTTPPVGTTGPTATPTPTSTPDITSQEVFTFCPSKEQGAGRKIRTTRKARQLLLKIGTNPQAADIRDVTILSVLLSRSLPIGSLVNLKIADYNSQAGTLMIQSSKKQLPRTIRIGLKTRALLDRYLSQVRPGSKETAPFFTAVDTTNLTLTTKDAVCLRELSKMVKQRARLNAITNQVVFIK